MNSSLTDLFGSMLLKRQIIDLRLPCQTVEAILGRVEGRRNPTALINFFFLFVL